MLAFQQRLEALMKDLAPDWKRIAALAALILWLMGFALDGPLMRDGRHLQWVLSALAFGLLLWGAFGWTLLFGRALLPSACVASGVTLGYAMLPPEAGLHSFLLVVAGIAVAPVCIYMGVLMRGCRRPVEAAALGVAMGNLLLVPITQLPLPASFKLVLAGCALPLGVLLRTRRLAAFTQGPVRALGRHALFIFVFELVGGLMYAQVWPVHIKSTRLFGAEAWIYALAAIVAVGIVRRYRDAVLILVSVLVIEAFAFRHFVQSDLGVHLMAYTMMVATGVMDVFVLMRILSYRNQLRAFGLLEGCVALGILCGYWLSSVMGDALVLVNLVAQGLLLIGLAVIFVWPSPVDKSASEAASLESGDKVSASGSSYLERSPKESSTHSEPPASLAQDVLPPSAGHAAAKEPSGSSPSPRFALLSAQEMRVAQACLQHGTYKDIAAGLGISESSVKTYMSRIFRKLQLKGRAELELLLRQRGSS